MSGVNLISFTVYNQNPNVYPDITYNAELGMTFEEFCSSKYNVDGWVVDELYSGKRLIKHQYDEYIRSNGVAVKSSDIIDSTKSYEWTA